MCLSSSPRIKAYRAAAGLGPTSEMGQKRRFGDVRVTSALPLKADVQRKRRHVSEWDGPAVLPPRTAQRMTGGLEARGAHRHVP
jgi:hypothetical protein